MEGEWSTRWKKKALNLFLMYLYRRKAEGNETFEHGTRNNVLCLAICPSILNMKYEGGKDEIVIRGCLYYD